MSSEEAKANSLNKSLRLTITTEQFSASEFLEAELVLAVTSSNLLFYQNTNTPTHTHKDTHTETSSAQRNKLIKNTSVLDLVKLLTACDIPLWVGMGHV